MEIDRAQPFAMLHGLMSAGRLDVGAFAQLWRATAAATAGAACAGAAALALEEGPEPGSRRKPQATWTPAEKQALMRHLAHHGYAGYPFF